MICERTSQFMQSERKHEHQIRRHYLSEGEEWSLMRRTWVLTCTFRWNVSLVNEANPALFSSDTSVNAQEKTRPVEISSVRAPQAGQTSLLGKIELASRKQQDDRGFEIRPVYICILSVIIIFLRFAKTVSISTYWIDELIRKKLRIDSTTLKETQAWNLKLC